MTSETYSEDPIPLWPSRPVVAHKGRGAISNIYGRFEVQTSEDYDDGWEAVGDGGQGIEAECGPLQAAASSPKTHVTAEYAKTILTRNASPDIPFNVSLNPYRGCEHGCIYCFARPTHSYLGLSPGLDFETRIIAKVNAPELLRRELAKASYLPELVALGVNTDAYQPCERELRITRRVLEVLHDCEHPVGLITKSSMIERDIDLLAPMAAKRQAAVTITITTLDHRISRTLEPRAASPARRLQTVQRLTEAGIPVGVNVAPIIPFVTEQELENVLEVAAHAGAISAGYIVLRLPWEVSPLFQEWLQAHFPDRAKRVMNRIRDMRGGNDYDSSFGSRMRGEGVWADLIKQRFEKAAKRFGIGDRGTRFASLDTSRFCRPAVVPAVVDDRQLELF